MHHDDTLQHPPMITIPHPLIVFPILPRVNGMHSQSWIDHVGDVASNEAQCDNLD